jgi:predicted nucleic acid-binding protein
VDLLDGALAAQAVAMAPVVLAELLSDPKLPRPVEGQLVAIGMLEITAGFWQRAGKMRAGLLRRRYRPKLADTLIAQSCIDHNVGLLTRDRDFRPFLAHGLKLA